MQLMLPVERVAGGEQGGAGEDEEEDHHGDADEDDEEGGAGAGRGDREDVGDVGAGGEEALQAAGVLVRVSAGQPGQVTHCSSVESLQCGQLSAVLLSATLPSAEKSI